MIFDLSSTTILTFEVGSKCNLSELHVKCPINIRNYKYKGKPLSVDMIVSTIQQAQNLNFSGFIAFHYYNEPLIKKEMILQVIEQLPNQNYLLWTNGLLLDRVIENNQFLNLFSKVVITCYAQENMSFFKELQSKYQQITILEHELDDRVQSYSRSHNNTFGCKRPLHELPIDYYGNLHLCCYDWNNTYEIGNINMKSFNDIICDEPYQKVLKNTKKRLLDVNTYPEICQKCDKPRIRYLKGLYL